MKRAWRSAPPGLGGGGGPPHEVEDVVRVGEVLREPLQGRVDGRAHAVHDDLAWIGATAMGQREMCGLGRGLGAATVPRASLARNAHRRCRHDLLSC